MCLESWPTTTTTRRPWRPSTWRAWSTSSSAASTPPCAATASSRSEGVVSSLAGKAGPRCTGTRSFFLASRRRTLANEWQLARPLIARNHLWRRGGLWRLLLVVMLVGFCTGLGAAPPLRGGAKCAHWHAGPFRCAKRRALYGHAL